MKTCDSCGEKHRSEEWSLSAELAKSNKRLFIALLVVTALWFVTIFGFVWYLNQYDYSSYEVTQDGEGMNNYNESGTQRDIVYGPNNQEESQS